MTTHYHVAPETWTEGADLLSWEKLEEAGMAPEWKWVDMPEGYIYPDGRVLTDRYVVCLFASIDEARDYQGEHGGKILEVDVSDLALTKVGEGYPAAWHIIPADCCKVVA